MNGLIIPAPDTIPVAWGWFQFLLLLTFPLHVLAMNAMLGCVAVAVVQQFLGGELRIRLAYRLAVALPLIIAFVVNLGVAPLLFLQVLYGHFVYTSSILMGLYWIMIIPILIVAYYGAYLYDFKFFKLRSQGVWLGFIVFCLLLVIAYFFSNNMLLMTLPESFAGYFENRNGTLLASGNPAFLPRYLHMITGALAVGGLAVALLGKIRKEEQPGLAEHAAAVGLKTFRYATILNIAVGTWYLLSLERSSMLLFMGGNMGATISFSIALLLVVMVVWFSFTNRLWPTVVSTVLLVYLMSFMRSWLRSDYLAEVFTLDQLQVVPEYSPMIFFFVTLVAGLACVGWLLKKTVDAHRKPVQPN